MGHIKKYDFSLLDEVLRVEKENGIIDWHKIFANNNPLIVEVGCGNGHFLTRCAMNDKTYNYIGIDKKDKRLIRCREKQIKYNLSNIRWISGDALLALEKLFPDESISIIFMPFPDPWPKKRHHKHRMFKKEFIELLVKKLEKNGKFAFITDYFEYYDSSYSLIKDDERFEIITPDEFLSFDLSESFFGEKWRNENRIFYSFYLRKK